MEIALVRADVLEVKEHALGMREARAGVPGCDVQFDHAVARDPEGNDAAQVRHRVVAWILRRSKRYEPLLPPSEPRHWQAPMPRHLLEAQAAVEGFA